MANEREREVHQLLEEAREEANEARGAMREGGTRAVYEHDHNTAAKERQAVELIREDYVEEQERLDKQRQELRDQTATLDEEGGRK